MAPEFYNEHYDEKVDIYAFGMCTLEMLTKEYPYLECTHPAQIVKCTMEGTMPRSLKRVKDKLAQDFIAKCLLRDSKIRLSARELKDHEFLKPNKDLDNTEILYPKKGKEAKEAKEAKEKKDAEADGGVGGGANGMQAKPQKKLDQQQQQQQQQDHEHEQA